MWNAEKHKHLKNDQQQGRNGRSSIDIVLSKSFILDMFHIQSANAAFLGYNAKACYNRIIPLELILAYLKMGLPYKTCVFFEQMLYHMIYYIAIAFKLGTKTNY